MILIDYQNVVIYKTKRNQQINQIEQIISLIIKTINPNGMFQYLKFKLIFLMQDELTTFLLQFTLTHKNTQTQQSPLDQSIAKTCPLTSKQLLNQIFITLNCADNYRDDRKHKFSISNDQTGSHTQTKCNCKKSKCLKLYCQCFAQGSFCQNCNCQSCQNTQEFSQIRAKAIDDMIMRSSINFGQKGSVSKGCNCRKTGCLKKYCQCFNVGQKCGQYCKCSNCSNAQ